MTLSSTVLCEVYFRKQTTAHLLPFLMLFFLISFYLLMDSSRWWFADMICRQNTTSLCFPLQCSKTERVPHLNSISHSQNTLSCRCESRFESVNKSSREPPAFSHNIKFWLWQWYKRWMKQVGCTKKRGKLTVAVCAYFCKVECSWYIKK